MAATALCPTCDMPTLDGVCRHCAFTAALAVASPSSSSGPTSVDNVQTPAGYELLHPLGAGATATVWLARECKLDRLVALKFISAHADRRLAQRLVREGQAVARLRHPNIVAVHAMDVTEGHAYLAMDFLAGGDLRQRLGRGLPSARDAAVLIRKLADALGHAHANAILHRDIKPSNVLLSPEGEPHLADFGLAAPLEGGGDLTLPGQVAGTAAYLAPELLAGADRASPQSDVYSLGAVLYECLAGRAPFVGDSNVSIFAQVASAEPAAPRLLRADIPRDLETICLKSLEKSPARRFVSATAMRDDLDRFLRGESIEARQAGIIEQSVRWCRRHPGTAAFGSLAAALLLGLAVGGPAVAVRLARARANAVAEAATSKALSDFLQNDLLAQADPENQPDHELKLRTVIERAAKKIAGRFPDQPMVEAEVRATLASTLYALGDYAAARAQWQRVRELRQRVLGAGDEKTLQAGAELFDALRAEGKMAEAEKLAHELTRTARQTLGPDHPLMLAMTGDLALLYTDAGKNVAAQVVYAELLPRHRRLRGAEHPDTLTILNNLGLINRRLGKLTDAEKYYSEALRLRRKVLGDDHPSTLTTMHNLSAVYAAQHNTVAAKALNTEVLERGRRVLGSDHPITLLAMARLALLHREAGEFHASAELLEQCLAAQRAKLGPNHPDVFATATSLAWIYRDEGRPAEALALNPESSLELRRQVLGPEHPHTIAMMSQLATTYRDLDRLADARRIATEALALCERVPSVPRGTTVQLLRLQGSILLREGDIAAAEALLKRSFGNNARPLGFQWNFAIAQSHYAQALLLLQRYAEAEPLLREAQRTFTAEIDVIPPADRHEIGDTAARLAQLNREWSAAREGSTLQAKVAGASAPP